MKSAVAVTLEMDDIGMAAKELINGICSQLTLLKNSCGILYYDYEIDGAALSGLLNKELDIDIVGCSTIAAIDGKNGYHELSATLTVLTGDDCEFSVTVSDPLTTKDMESNVLSTYNQAASKLTTPAKLIFAVPNCDGKVSFERPLEILSTASEHIPIIGGIPSSMDTEFGEVSMTCNGEVFYDRIIILLFGGHVKPLFTLSNVISRFSDKSCVVTHSENQIIYEVDNGVPFTDFLKQFGFDTSGADSTMATAFYRKYPLLIKDTYGDNSGLPYVRILDSVNNEKGYGVAYSSVPEGSTITLGVFKEDEISRTSSSGMTEILGKINENNTDDYTYNTILAITCGARRMILTPHYDVEGNTIKSALPDHISLSAFYSYGEIAPTSYVNGKANNRLHNGSILFCAL